MIPKIQAFWNSLPHAAKTVIVIFCGAAYGVLHQTLSANGACLTNVCLKADAIEAMRTGSAAVVALYIPSPFKKTEL
jgi:hypothetical protein